MPHLHPHRDGQGPMECPPKLPFLVFTFHLLMLGRIEGERPLRGSPGPHMSAHPKCRVSSPYTQHKPRASLCPCRSLPMLYSPLPAPSGAVSSGVQGLMGAGAKLGAQEVWEGEEKRCSVTSHQCPLGGGPRRGEGVPGGYFSIFYFQIFFCIQTRRFVLYKDSQ